MNNCLECDNSEITILHSYSRCKLTGNCYIPSVVAEKIPNECPIHRKEKVMTTQFLNQPTKERVHVVGLADHEDGDAYEIAAHFVPLADAFVTAIRLLSESADHVLIVDDEAYNNHAHSLLDLVPYSIHITKGIHA